MPNRIRRIGATSARVQRLRKQYERRTGNSDYVYLAKVDGKFEAPRIGYYWVHKPSGKDDNGNTTYGAPFQLPVDGRPNFPYRNNLKLEVITKRDGITYIRGASGIELINMGYDPRQFNLGNPRTKDVLLEHILNGQNYKTDSTTTVQVNGSIYRKSNGDYAFLQTQDVDIVTGNTPSDSNQVVVCVWLDESDNTLSTTVSSEETINTDFTKASNIATAMSLINECAASAPSDALGTTSWLLYSDGTFQKFHDIRGIYGSANTSIDWPITLTADRTLSANTQIVLDKIIVPTGFTLTIESTALMKVI